MPYTTKKRYYRKRKPYTGRRGRKSSGWGRYLGYAKKAFYMAKGLKSLINVEYKYKDTLGASYTQGVTPTWTCLNVVTQGDSSTSRDGDSILMKSLGLKAIVKMDSAATEVTYLRMTLCQVVQANGSVLNGSGIWETGTGDLFTKKRELKYTDNNKVLKNYNIMLQPGGKQMQVINLNWKFKDHVKYKGSAGTYADIYTNQLWLYVEAGSDTHKPTVEWSSRLRFIDN